MKHGWNITRGLELKPITFAGQKLPIFLHFEAKIPPQLQAALKESAQVQLAPSQEPTWLEYLCPI